MMNPLEPVLATAVALVVVVTAVLATPPNPRPKPEPPIVETIEPASQPQTAPGRVSAEPLPPEVVEQKKVEQIAQDIDATQRDLAEIKEIIRLQQLERAIKSMPNE